MLFKVGMGIFEEERELGCMIPINMDVTQYSATKIEVTLKQTTPQGMSISLVIVHIRDSADDTYIVDVNPDNPTNSVTVNNPPIKLIEMISISGQGDGSVAVKGAIINDFLGIKLYDANGNVVLDISVDGKYWANVIDGDPHFSVSLSAVAGEEKTEVLKEFPIDFDTDIDFRLEWEDQNGTIPVFDIFEMIFEYLSGGNVIGSNTVDMKNTTSPSPYMTIPAEADTLRIKLHYKASQSVSAYVSNTLKFKIPPP